MRISLASLVAAGVIGVAGITGLALVGPALVPANASPVEDEAPAHHPVLRDRPADVKAALADLVSDGTLTQAQADAVAAKLREVGPRGPDGPHGPRGPRLRAGGVTVALGVAAKALGITPGELRTALRQGDTLAEVAKAHGVDVPTLVDALVKAATTRVDAAVADGRLTSARAEKIKAQLRERITDLVQEGLPMRGRSGL
ncbi:MAG TPA: hypothetical protein VLC50_00135 [Actinomycetes bacterium]|nr:hypothetical protein [Actinomycetes bacterium]